MVKSSECGVCHKDINMADEDWMEVQVQLGDITIPVIVCEDHANIIRANAARKIVQAI